MGTQIGLTLKTVPSATYPALALTIAETADSYRSDLGKRCAWLCLSLPVGQMETLVVPTSQGCRKKK